MAKYSKTTYNVPKQDLGDELNYMLNCSFFTDARKSLLPN